MRTTLRALSALVITGLLVGATASVASAEDTREACWQQKVGSLRLATEVLPCKDTSENSIILQTGEPSGGVSAVSGFEIVQQEFTYSGQDGFREETLSCPAGKVALGWGESRVKDPVYGYSVGVAFAWPISASTWGFKISYSGEGTPLTMTLYLTCVVGS